MSDRTINFGESETEATYQIQDTDSTGGGNFVVAKDTNANTVLLQYDPDTDTWEYAGDVDINGGNVSGVGTLTAESVNTEDVDAESVNTEEASITEQTQLKVSLGSSQNISSGELETLELDNVVDDNLGEFDTTEHDFTPTETGIYLIVAVARFSVSSSGDSLTIGFDNKTDDDIILLHSLNAGGSDRTSLNALGLRGLKAGKEYQVLVRNDDSDDSLSSGQRNTFLNIWRLPV